MKFNKVKIAASGILVVLFALLLNTSVQAFGIEFRQAGNACFPRTFSQLDFFRMSNGGLRNNSTTPKSVVCSYDVTYDTDNVPGVNGIGLFIIADSLVSDMECVFQLRDISANNTVLESETVMVLANSGDFVVGVPSAPFTTEISFQHHVFVQCRLPAQGRITSLFGGYDNLP